MVVRHEAGGALSHTASASVSTGTTSPARTASAARSDRCLAAGTRTGGSWLRTYRGPSKPTHIVNRSHAPPQPWLSDRRSALPGHYLDATVTTQDYLLAASIPRHHAKPALLPQ